MVHKYPDRHPYEKSTKIPLVQFQSRIVQNALNELLTHLSKATTQNLQNAAQDVKRQLDSLFLMGFHHEMDGPLLQDNSSF